MRATSMMLLSVVGFGSVVACGGGGGDATPNPVPLSNGTYQKPPSSYEPVTSNPPPNDYQNPPSSYQPSGGSGGELCDSICSVVTSLSCLTGGVVGIAACQSSCMQKIASQPCVPQLADLTACVFDAVNLTCDLLEKLQNGDVNGMDGQSLAACQGAADAYTACSGNGDNGPGNGNGNGNGACDPGGDCSGCLNACAKCGCMNFATPEKCTNMCQ